MRVLLICNYKPGVGGISGQVELLQKYLREEGHEVDIFSTKDSVWRRIRMSSKLCRVAKPYDVLHIHCCSGWGFLPAVVGITVGRRLGKRIVLTYHGGGGESFFDRRHRLASHFLSRTDANIVLSGFLAQVFEKHKLPYTVIPNIIELDDAQFRERDILRPSFICTRAHEPLYNIPCILRAFQKVQKKRPEAMLTLIGSGSQHDNLVQMVKGMELRNVTFTGRIENKDIYQYLDQSDIFVSAPKVDNMPVSILEALNAGLLVISSRVGGVPYMVEEGVTGLLFESDNDTELAERMLWAVENQSQAKCMILCAHKSVKRYCWESIKENVYTTYGISA